VRGRCGLGWSAGGGGCGLEVCWCGAGAGKISQIPTGAGLAGLVRTKSFNPRRTLVSCETIQVDESRESLEQGNENDEICR